MFAFPVCFTSLCTLNNCFHSYGIFQLQNKYRIFPKLLSVKISVLMCGFLHYLFFLDNLQFYFFTVCWTRDGKKCSVVFFGGWGGGNFFENFFMPRNYYIISFFFSLEYGRHGNVWMTRRMFAISLIYLKHYKNIREILIHLYNIY